MPWWGRWISHCCCWEPIERRSLLPKSTIAQRKRQLKTKHCIRLSPRLTTFSNGDLKSDSAIYVRKTAVILNVFPIAPDLASFSPLGIVNPFALRLYLPNIFMLLLTVHNRHTNSKQLLWRSYESFTRSQRSVLSKWNKVLYISHSSVFTRRKNECEF